MPDSSSVIAGTRKLEGDRLTMVGEERGKDEEGSGAQQAEMVIRRAK